jgi:DNA integrity scanning protein DisA with diadenylate cyclase activity
MDVGREFEIFSSKDLCITSKMDKPHVFDRLLTLTLELAEEGKEGKPLGTIFILGDDKKVMELSSQMVINHFAGVPEAERNIMDSGLKETIREFATIDGAFIIRDDGVILAARCASQGFGGRRRASPGTGGTPQGRRRSHRPDRRYRHRYIRINRGCSHI